MFDRFVRMAQARSALRAGDHERALRLLGDPSLDPDHRRVRELRKEGIAGLLERAQRALEAGRFAAAQNALRVILAVEPEQPGALSALFACREREAERGQRLGARGALLREFEEALARGDLGGATDIARRAGDADQAALLGRVEDQRARAAELVSQVPDHVASLGFDGAVRRLRQARGLDGALVIERGLRDALASELARSIRALPEPSRAEALSRALRAARDVALEIGSAPGVADLVGGSDQTQLEAVLSAIDRLDLDRAADLQLASEAIGRLPAGVSAAIEAARRGAFDVAALALAESVPGNQLAARVARGLESRASEAQARLDEARTAAQVGSLAEARATLLALLERFPGHETAKAELELLDHGADARAKELMEARALVRERRLATAAARALPWALPGPEGDEARALLREVQPQLDVVRKGVGQVQASLHGPGSGSVEGLGFCLQKLARLDEIQVDSADLARLREAIESEIEGVRLFEGAGDALRAGVDGPVRAALSGWADLRSRLCEAGRLDAHAENLVERLLARAEDAMAAGHCARADALLGAVGDALPLPAGLHGKVRALRGDVTGRRIRAAHEARVASQNAVVERDLDAAREALERARALAEDEPSVRRVAAELERVMEAARRAEQAEALGEGVGPEDVADARRSLEDLGGTPPALRTRVFDLKRNLARAQGLDGGFLLRVDEAGEFLVFRQETATIGNVRDAGCDLPLQARVVSRHARLRRTMSFHGGQVDEVVAERGELVVSGATTPKVRLTDGVRFGLGHHVELRYRLPSHRSLTARIDLLGGFDLGGASALLWLKDRGRDGRILIGADAESHIRVPGARGTLELFAGSDGRIRVRAEGGGEIDGVPFDGEHPVAGGVFVSALGVGFSIQPWSPSDATAPIA